MLSRKRIQRRQQTFEAIFTYDADGWWLAEVPSINACFTQGKSLRATRIRLLDAISTMLDLDEEIEAEQVKAKYVIPRSCRRAFTVAVKAEHAATKAVANAKEKLRSSTSAMSEAGISTRDVAELFQVSHNTIARLLRDEG